MKFFHKFISRHIFAKQAKKKAEREYDIFNKTQKIDSDFDKRLKKLEKDTDK